MYHIMTNPLNDLRDIISTHPDSLVPYKDAWEIIKQHKSPLVELHEEYFIQDNPHHYDVSFARISANYLIAYLLKISASCIKLQLDPSDNDLIRLCRDIVANMISAQKSYVDLEEEMNHLESILDKSDLGRVSFEILDVVDHLIVHPLIVEVADLPLDDKDDA